MSLSSTRTWIWPTAGKVDLFQLLQNDPSTKSKELTSSSNDPQDKNFLPFHPDWFSDRKLFSNDSGASYGQILALVKQLQSDAALNSEEWI